MRGTRTFSALVVALGLSGVSMPADAAPARPQVTVRGGHQAGQPDGDQRVLADDMVRPTARAGTAARIRKWPGKTIPYYESLPAKWDWSLDQAVAHWNESGGKIKFVEVKRSKAKLVIGYGDTGGADGVGTLGYQSRNFVNLSPAYKKADQYNPETRVWVGRLLTHELGHVLGFSHTTGQCSLMYPVYDFGVCETLPFDKPGYYNCRWIDKKLLRRFTQMYGGKPKRPPAVCLIEALPDPLRSVAFSGGNTQGKPVRITWLAPTALRSGTKVYVGVWKGTSCTTPPDNWERRDPVEPKAGSWTDPTYGKGSWCYQLQIENRYGATRPPTASALVRYAPVPSAPAAGTPTWRPQDGGWRFTWAPPLAGTNLVVMRNATQRDQCVPAFDANQAEYLDPVTANTWLLRALAPQECLTLYVVTDWGTVSPATTVNLVVPSSPAAPTPGTLAWDPDFSAFRFSWTPPDDFTSLRAMRSYDTPGTCPTSYVENEAEWLGRDYSTGKWLLYANHASQCVSLYAVTNWGTVSPRAQVTAQVPAPTATPVVGTVAPWSVDPSWAASATATLTPSFSYDLRIEVVQGACPAVPPTDANWSDGFEDGSAPGRYVFYPEPWGDTGQQCAMFAAVDYYGQHGPVVARAFTIPGA
jgi:Matrixin